jgi:hypothetical protein
VTATRFQSNRAGVAMFLDVTVTCVRLHSSIAPVNRIRSSAVFCIFYGQNEGRDSTFHQTEAALTLLFVKIDSNWLV